MYNLLCNKQDGLFFSNISYLYKGQGSPNEFKNTYKHIITLTINQCLFYDNILNFYVFLQC